MTGFKKLENSLIDVIKEEQAKLGFKEREDSLILSAVFPESFLFCARTAQKKWLARLAHLPEALATEAGAGGRCLTEVTASAFIFRSQAACMCMRI